MSWDRTSRYASTSSNFLVRPFRGHPLDGRHLIDFTDKLGGDFTGWCSIWADVIQFGRLQYCKKNTGVEHEFICLHELRRNPNHPFPPAQLTEKNLWESLESGPEDRVCVVERMANPDTPVDALVRADAADYINIFRKESEEVKEQLADSSVILEVSFSEEHTLADVLDICYRISRHSKAQYYTLQQYNCFFFSWNIILGLLRSNAGWGTTVARQFGAIHSAVDGWLQELAATEGMSNLALVVAGTGSIQGPRPGSHSSLTHFVSKHFSSESYLQELRGAFQSALWTAEQEDVIRGIIRRMLDKVADKTTNLLTDGTGETSLNGLMLREDPLGVPPDWEKSISAEQGRLFGEFVNSVVWPHFQAALESGSQTATRGDSRSNLSLGQKARYSQPVLMARLSPLGCKTAWRNARAEASGHDLGGKLNSFLHLAKTLQHTPKQMRNIAQISGSFVSLVGAELEKSAAAGQPIKIKGVGDNLLELVRDLSIDPSGLEDQVVSELEWSIKNMVAAHEGCDHHTLRLATLQLLLNLKNKGEELKFYVDISQIWRIGLWFCLGKGIVGSVSQVTRGLCTGAEPKYRCQQAVTVSKKKFVVLRKRELTYSEIQLFILGRVKELSERANKDTLRLAETCQQEIEQAMSEIWKDRESWKDHLGEIPDVLTSR
ncbi:hypothetical protein FS749_008030 [Ceratobasidium sp. UAMH 11750]|nr:hypothetical protein FS749_008030 [Ceratobasidium sp. UAMH 11750]